MTKNDIRVVDDLRVRVEAAVKQAEDEDLKLLCAGFATRLYGRVSDHYAVEA